MTKPCDPVPKWNEEERLYALDTYGILDTPVEQDFDDIAGLAARFCNAPISVINFIAADRQWFKSEIGLGVRETPLNVSICAKAILQPGIFTVSDLSKDARFEGNPLVAGKPQLRFYAGAQLETADGFPLGTLCVLDYKARTLTDNEAVTLKALAGLVMAQLELRRALKAKSASEERLGLALNASGFVGIWEWDIVRDRVYADEQFVAAFGGEPHWSTLGAPIADYVKAIHPDDLGGISVAIQQALHPGGAIFQQEYRLLQKDGSVRWIEARGRCNFDAGGNPVRFPGVAVDITARKASQREALDLADRYRFVTNSMPHKIATANASGKLDFVNQEWMEYTGLSSRRLIESGCLEAIHPDDAGERLKRWKQSITETKSFEMEYRLRDKAGSFRWHHAKVVPKHNAHGELSMWIWSDVDVDELRRTRRR